MSRIILGVTGASGAIYATRTAKFLKEMGHSVCALVTNTGRAVIDFEGEIALYNFCDETPNVNDFFAECASGSANYKAMAILPCSMGTLGRIANGTADNLLIRAADVMLKEKKPLVIVPREMPYNLIHLKNMETLTLAGAQIISASPHFYNHPTTVENLVDTVVAKIIQHLGFKNNIVEPWKGENF